LVYSIDPFQSVHLFEVQNGANTPRFDKAKAEPRPEAHKAGQVSTMPVRAMKKNEKKAVVSIDDSR
jgi:hypothetical protein